MLDSPRVKQIKKECRSNSYTRLKKDLSALTHMLSFIYNHKADILSIALSLELSGGDRLMLATHKESENKMGLKLG